MKKTTYTVEIARAKPALTVTITGIEAPSRDHAVTYAMNMVQGGDTFYQCNGVREVEEELPRVLDDVDLAYLAMGAEAAMKEFEASHTEDEREEVSDRLSGHVGYITEVYDFALPVLAAWFANVTDDDMNGWGAILQYEVIEPFGKAIGAKVIANDEFIPADVLADVLPKREKGNV